MFDNPYLADSGDYEAMLLSLPEHQRKQLLDGNWDINEGAAFPEFNRNIHVVEPIEILVDGLSLELATMVTVPTLEYSGSLYHQVSNWLYTESFIVLKLQLLI